MLENYSDVLEIKELCEILRIDRKTAYHILHNGELFGRHYKIPKESVIRYLQEF